MIQWPQGKAGKMCFGSLIFFRAARGCQICLKPMLTCSDIACLGTTNIICDILAPRSNTKPLTWTRYSMLQQQGIKKFDGLTKTTSGRGSNSHRDFLHCFSMTIAMQGNTGQEWYGDCGTMSPYFTHEVVRLPCASILRASWSIMTVWIAREEPYSQHSPNRYGIYSNGCI